MLWPERRLRRRARRGGTCLVLLLLLVRTICDHFDAIIRESPVDFAALHRLSNLALSPPEKPVRISNGSHIDHRYTYQRTLKAGGQGSVYLYQDTLSMPPKLVIVKTISANARNQLPVHLLSAFKDVTFTWPSEIDASLSVIATNHDQASPYVPVYDYFILRNGCATMQDWTWAIVTPYISSGTLIDLANEVRSIGRTDEVDRTFRSTFYNLLGDLQALHRRGFCHDDVKPGNIFIASPRRWLLGDLGNTREVTHPWHQTRLWQRRNQWSDCRLNDERRAWKSYLSFLRQASHDREQFDLDFLGGSTEWATLYWNFMYNPTSRPHSLMDLTGKWTYNLTGNLRLPGWYSTAINRSLRAAAVKQELLCTSLWWKLWLTP